MNALHTLAERYARETEDFDKSICTGIRHGISVPETSAQRAASSRNAIQLNQLLLNMALAAGFTEKEWNDARRYAIHCLERKLHLI